MPTCLTCQNYYRLSPYNDTDHCDLCAYSSTVPMFDDEDTLEVDHLLNPTGATKPVFYD